MTDEPTDLQAAASALAASASKQKLSVLHTISHCAGTFRLYIAAKGVGPPAMVQCSVCSCATGCTALEKRKDNSNF